MYLENRLGDRNRLSWPFACLAPPNRGGQQHPHPWHSRAGGGAVGVSKTLMPNAKFLSGASRNYLNPRTEPRSVLCCDLPRKRALSAAKLSVAGFRCFRMHALTLRPPTGSSYTRHRDHPLRVQANVLLIPDLARFCSYLFVGPFMW